MAVKTVSLSGELSMDVESMENLLSELAPLWQSHTLQVPVRLDLSQVTFIHPSAVTLLTTAVLSLQHSRFEVQIIYPQDQNVHTYLTCIHFYDLVGEEVGYPWQEHDPTGRFLPVKQAQSEREGETIVSELMEILSRNLQGFHVIQGAVHYAFLEIMSNVFHHAQSPTHAVICAQFYPWHQQVEVSVVDGGRGIPDSLRGNPVLVGRFRTDAEAIELATRPRVTGRPDHNTGEGLFFSLEFVKANGGQACIHSKTGALRVEGKQTRTHGASLWPGTCVALCFRTDQPVDTEAIFNHYAPPEEDFEWLFDDDTFLDF